MTGRVELPQRATTPTFGELWFFLTQENLLFCGGCSPHRRPATASIYPGNGLSAWLFSLYLQRLCCAVVPPRYLFLCLDRRLTFPRRRLAPCGPRGSITEFVALRLHAEIQSSETRKSQTLQNPPPPNLPPSTSRLLSSSTNSGPRTNHPFS